MNEEEQGVNRPFLSWIEWLVIAIALVVFAGLFLPVYRGGSQGAARRTVCFNNLRQLGIAVQGYNAAHQRFPSGAATNGQSMFVKLLPYLDYKNLSDDIRGGISLADASKIDLEIFRCPNSNKAMANWPRSISNDCFSSDYVASAGPVSRDTNSQYSRRTHTKDSPAYVYDLGDKGLIGLSGMFSPRIVAIDDQDVVTAVKYLTKTGIQAAEVTDGLSNTVMFMEASRDNIVLAPSGKHSFTNERPAWAFGQSTSTAGELKEAYFCRSTIKQINSFDSLLDQADPIHELCISSNHPGGAAACRGDGSIVFVNEEVDLLVLQAATGINEGESADLDQ
jgi:hypothetical protein